MTAALLHACGVPLILCELRIGVLGNVAPVVAVSFWCNAKSDLRLLVPSVLQSWSERIWACFRVLEALLRSGFCRTYVVVLLLKRVKLCLSMTGASGDFLSSLVGKLTVPGMGQLLFSHWLSACLGDRFTVLIGKVSLGDRFFTRAILSADPPLLCLFLLIRALVFFNNGRRRRS